MTRKGGFYLQSVVVPILASVDPVSHSIRHSITHDIFHVFISWLSWQHLWQLNSRRSIAAGVALLLRVAALLLRVAALLLRVAALLLRVAALLLRIATLLTTVAALLLIPLLCTANQHLFSGLQLVHIFIQWHALIACVHIGVETKGQRTTDQKSREEITSSREEIT